VGVQGFAENASGAQVAAGITGSQGASSVVVSTSASGLSWSAPVTLDTGANPAVAIAPNGRVVVAWEGGPATASVIQASVRAPGSSTWSAPVNVSTDTFGGPVIGMDGSGNTIAAWAGGAGEIRTASLPAGGSWTAVDTLDTQVDGFDVDLAVNATGSAVISWAEPARATMADSGTILGGFGTPVLIDAGAAQAAGPVQAASLTGPHSRVTLDAYDSPGLSGAPQVSRAYLHGHTQVVLSNSGEASLSWAVTTTVHKMATRSPSGTWSAPVLLPVPGPGSGQPDLETAVDGAGDVITVYDQFNASGVSSAYLTRLPAGSSTWSTPVVLADPGSLAMAAGDAAGTFVVAFKTASGLSVLTSPPGGSFGPATTFPATDSASALTIVPGHAALVINSDAVTTEPVS
jgi:hypothetical protein